MAGKTYQVSIPLVAKNLTKSAIKEVQADFKKLEKSLSNITRLSEKIGNVGSKFKTAGKEMLFAGVAIAAPLGYAAKKASDFESEMARVATMMEGGASEATAKFGDTIKKLSLDTGLSTTKLNDALFESISAGISQGEASDYMAKASIAAVGGFADLQTVINGTTSIINAYGMKAGDVLKITDQLSIANEVGKTTFEKLSAEVGSVAAMASQFGVSSGEMLAAVGAVTKVTGQTSEAFTGLQGLLTSIAKPTDDAVKEISRLNASLSGKDKLIMSIQGMQKLGFEEWFRRLRKATKGSAESINRLVGDNIRGANFLRTLLATEGTFADTLARMNKTTSEGKLTTENYNEALETSTVKFARMKAQLDDLALTLGEAALPVITKFIEKLRGYGVSAANAMKKNKEFINSIINMAIVVAPILIGAGGISYAFGVVLKTVSSLVKVVGLLRGALTMLAAHPAVAIILGLALAAGILIKTIYDRDKEAKKLQGYQGAAGKYANNASMQNLNQAAADRKKIKSGAQVAIGDYSVGAGMNVGLQGMAGEGKKFKNQAEALADYQKYQGALTTVVQGSVEKRVKAEKKGQEDMSDLLDKALTDQREKIDMFSEGGGRDILDAAGFASSAISSAVGKNPKPPDRRVSIGNITLPNVGDREDFISELNKISLGFGVA